MHINKLIFVIFNVFYIFYVLLTVHLSIFISVIKQLDAQNFVLQQVYFMPLHVLSTCAHRTYRCDDTRGCVMQFRTPDDKHMCSKHVEA